MTPNVCNNGHYRAYAPAVPEVTALGETPERAQAQLVTALAAHLKTLRDHGEPLPPDRTRVTRVGLSLELWWPRWRETEKREGADENDGL